MTYTHRRPCRERLESRVQTNLVKHSVSNNLENALKEWEFIRVLENGKNKCPLCSITKTRGNILIRNKITGENLPICYRCLLADVTGLLGDDWLKIIFEDIPKQMGRLRLK